METQSIPLQGQEGLAKLDAAWVLENPDQVSADIARAIIQQHEAGAVDTLKAAVVLGAILLLLPELGDCVPLSFLQQLRRLEDNSTAWQHLALILLHSQKGEETCQWLQAIDKGDDRDVPLKLLEYLCDWFPERVDRRLLAGRVDPHSPSPELIRLIESQMFREKLNPLAGAGSKITLSSVLPENARLLVVHNIIDGQGDEMVRTYALLQALLDGFPSLEMTLFTDRLYLYDHPRLRTISISDTQIFSEMLKERWAGVLSFFEPYHSGNTYNLALQESLQEYLRVHRPAFFLWARKHINHFVFQSVVLDGKECAATFAINQRRLPLSYETTMRLIVQLGLPLRIGEDKPRAGAVPTSNSRPDLAQTWQDLTRRLQASSRTQSTAVVNIFGGQKPTKGFTPDNFDRLAAILQHLVNEGYGVVIVPNGDEWGGASAIEAVRDCLSAEARQQVIAAPIVANAQENMRQLKYFVSLCDLVVTVEGWMMHLAYALAKPYRLLMASYSYTSEWHPHGRTANQGRWIPPIDRAVRRELALPNPAVPNLKPPAVHYPEKDVLESALALWASSGDINLCQRLGYWMSSNDKDIRKWLVTTLGKVDSSYFRSRLIEALKDRNHEVRAAAANVLLNSGEDLTEALSAEWQQELLAFKHIGEFRFNDAGALGPALAALRACLSGDESEVRRDAKVVMEQME